MPGTFMARMKAFDSFSKGVKGTKKRTLVGGAVTAVSSVLIVYLFYVELRLWRRVETNDHLFVDPGHGEASIPVSLHMSFPNLRCANVWLDAEDNVGVRFGGDSVKDAEARKKALIMNKFGYVAPYHFAANPEKYKPPVADAIAPGCTLRALLTVPKASGSFHVALGDTEQRSGAQSAQSGNVALRHFSIAELQAYNASHVIHSLAFGSADALPPGYANPLDGTANAVEKGAARFQYFIKIVPTVYHPLSGKPSMSNQFSATEHTTRVNLAQGIVPHPGVFFKYDFSSIMMRVTKSRKGFTRFLTNVCAICGGVFVSAGLVVRLVNGGLDIAKKLD